MITIEISLKNSPNKTIVSGNTIQEALEKVKFYHTMTDFERSHYDNKTELERELNSGWWL